MSAISNTIPSDIHPVRNSISNGVREHESGYKIVTFMPTPKMSTYLVAFIVGNFEHIEKKTREGVLVRVFVTPGKKHQAEFALECAVKILSFFSRYFAIPYPLPVLDLIAIPDFAAGAMENWGAVTYRESAILVDPEHTSAATKQWVALVIAHELSHQWFGNLVTMEWWTHLWLNEGFASYIEYLVVDHLFPKWDMWTQFAYQDLGRALELDSLEHSHPIEVNVHHPNEISEIFDAVSYSKGASVIRMLADYLGEKDFRDGLRHYLKKHSYKNTATIHLWQAFEKISRKPVSRMMADWTRKAGYPLVSVSTSPQGIKLRQKRFFSSPISAQRGSHPVWNIPVRVREARRKQTYEFLMGERTRVLARDAGTWLKLNSGEFGFYRTKYDPLHRKALEQPIRAKTLEARDRLGLVRDAFALAEAGELRTTEALELAQSYSNETDYTVWLEVASGIGDVRSLIGLDPTRRRFDEFAREIFRVIAKRVGWEKRPGERHTETLLRSLVLMSFGSYGDAATIAWAKKLFSKIRRSRNPISPDLRRVVYGLVAKNGGRKEHVVLTRHYVSASLHEEKNRIGWALAQFKDSGLLKKTLAFSLSKHVRHQDTVGIVASVWSNPYGRDLAWRFVRAKWKIFLARYAGQHGFSYLLAPASSFRTTAKAMETRRFFKKHPAPGCERTIRQTLEKIYSNEAWFKRDRKALADFLN